MKLLTKTTLYFLVAIIPLLAIAGYFMFDHFNKQINERADQELLYEEVQWVQYLKAATSNGSNFILRSPDLLIYPVDKETSRYPRISTLYGTKANENVQVPFRQLEHVVNINGIHYQILIRKSQEQKLALITNIATSMLLVFAGLLLATLIFNYVISKRLWKPFRTSLQKIRNIELQKMADIHFEPSGIREFNELNASLNSMTDKIQKDYINMKEFTEDAAHEMQTPLAVAHTKLELLLQDAHLDASHTEAVVQASAALNRLSKLNQSLLLLAKIDNNQYDASVPINLADTTRKYLNLFDEMIRHKKIIVETNIREEFECRIHPFLADSLISNLIGNAIKYNRDYGKLIITSDQHTYCISNTSHLTGIDPDNVFRRFKSASVTRSDSNGLGLAIIKKIADTHQLSVSYRHENDMHIFCLRK